MLDAVAAEHPIFVLPRFSTEIASQLRQVEVAWGAGTQMPSAVQEAVQQGQQVQVHSAKVAEAGHSLLEEPEGQVGMPPQLLEHLE